MTDRLSLRPMTCYRIHDPVFAEATIVGNGFFSCRIGDYLSGAGSRPSETIEMRSV